MGENVRLGPLNGVCPLICKSICTSLPCKTFPGLWGKKTSKSFYSEVHVINKAGGYDNIWRHFVSQDLQRLSLFSEIAQLPFSLFLAQQQHPSLAVWQHRFHSVAVPVSEIEAQLISLRPLQALHGIDRGALVMEAIPLCQHGENGLHRAGSAFRNPVVDQDASKSPECVGLTRSKV